MPVLSEDTPAINFAVIKSLAIGNDAFVMEEAAKLAEELGLGEPDAPDFDEDARLRPAGASVGKGSPSAEQKHLSSYAKTNPPQPAPRRHPTLPLAS
jgi:hypothetical protein